MVQSKSYPVVTAGGSNSCLWPFFRVLYPKQFLCLKGDLTMLQTTICRLSGVECESPVVICNEQHRFIVAEQLHQLNKPTKNIILEPAGRNIASATVLAVLATRRHSPENDPLMLVLAADHVIADEDTFRAAVRSAMPYAEAGKLVTPGIVPDLPETGYSYTRRGEVSAGEQNMVAFEVAQSAEEPNLGTTQVYAVNGEYYWNSGTFLFRVGRYLEELKEYRPDTLDACERAISTVDPDLDFIRVDEEVFLTRPGESVDYAVMEHAADAVVVPMDTGWSDVGSWSSLWEISTRVTGDNIYHGDMTNRKTENGYVYAESGLVTTTGMRDLVVVQTGDAVLIADRNAVQDVKRMVEQTKVDGRHEHRAHREVYHPWSRYDSIDAGNRHQMKRITVKSGEGLSVQMHYHHAEHWVAVAGMAKITIDGDIKLFGENESIYIPLGVTYCLESLGKIPLDLIEARSGSYLEEDDTMRFADRYGRVQASHQTLFIGHGVDTLSDLRFGSAGLIRRGNVASGNECETAVQIMTKAKLAVSARANYCLKKNNNTRRLACLKAYDIRGKLGEELNEDIAWYIGHAYGELLRPKTIVLDGDVRLTSETLKLAPARDLQDAGIDVLDIGMPGTEEICFAMFHLGVDGGIEIITSHSPMDYSGMRLVREGARPVSGDTGLRDVQRLAEANDFPPVSETKRGRYQQINLRNAYIDYLLDYINVKDLTSLKPVTSSRDGAAGPVMDATEARSEVFDTPAELIKVHNTPDGNFPDGVPDSLLPERRGDTRNAVIKYGADIGIVFDGSFDHCFLLNEKEQFIEGYYIVGLLTETLLEKNPDMKAIHDPRLSQNTVDVVTVAGGTPTISKIKHASIKERVRKEDAIYGGEMSAHHHFHDFAYCDSGMIPWLLVAKLVRLRGKTLGKLVRDRTVASPTSGEINSKLAHLVEAINHVEQYFSRRALAVDCTDDISIIFASWCFDLRSSNTEPMVRLNVESHGDVPLMEARMRALLTLLNE